MVVSIGYKEEFLPLPLPCFMCSSLPVHRPADHHAALADPLNQGVIVIVPAAEKLQSFYSNLFNVSKPKGGNHPILDLNALNVFIWFQKIGMKSTRPVILSSTPKCPSIYLYALSLTKKSNLYGARTLYFTRCAKSAYGSVKYWGFTDQNIKMIKYQYKIFFCFQLVWLWVPSQRSWYSCLPSCCCWRRQSKHSALCEKWSDNQGK